MHRAKFKGSMIAAIAVFALAICTIASAAPRELNEAERALVDAFLVYKVEGSYRADVIFSDAIDDGEFVWSDDEIAELGYTPHTKIIEASRTSRISYSWYRGTGDWGRGVGIAATDGAWIAEASAGTESASIILLHDGDIVSRINVPPIAVNDIEDQELFDQLEATRAGYSDTFDGVTFLTAPLWDDERADAWKALGEPEKVFPAAREDGAGDKIRFVSTRDAVVELRSTKSDTTIFSEKITAGHVFEFTAPIMPNAEESEYIIIFRSDDDDDASVVWDLQEKGHNGRRYRSVWRFDYAVG